MKTNFVNQDFKKRVTKKTLLLFIPLLLLVSCLVFFKYRAEKNCKLNFIGNSQSQYLLREEKIINESLTEVLNDLGFLSGLELSVPVITERNYSRAIGEDVLLRFIESRKNYDRIMISGTDGERILSVEKNSGTPIVFSGRNLKGTHKTDKFAKNIKLKNREIFVSILEPGKTDEAGTSSSSVIRFGINLNDHQGNVKGMVTVDYIMNYLRLRLEPFPRIPGFRMVLVDSKGKTIGSGNKGGSDFLWNIKKEASRFLRKSGHSRDGQIYSNTGLYSFVSIDPVFGEYHFSTQNTDPNGNVTPPWVLVSYVPRNYIHEMVIPLKKSNLLILTLLMFLILFSCITLAFAYEKRKKEALVDPLTSLWNRRFFLEKVDRLQQDLNGGDTSACMAVIDLGNFKEINDNFGHKTGDSVLKKAAQVIRDNLRISDDVARYGGDEFAIFLPRTDKKEAQIILERVCKKIIQVDRQLEGLTLDADFGIGEYPVDSRDLMDLIDIADANMYESKRRRKKLKHEKLKLRCTCLE